MKLTIFHVLLFTIVSYSSLAQPSISNEEEGEIPLSAREKIFECNRQEVIENYNIGYLGTSVSTEDLAWDGDIDVCSEGSISEIALERTKLRINYFRNLVGIPNGVIFSEIKNEKCQKAVLMMNAAKDLDHYPTSDWECSSPEGIEAAGKSNLSFGRHSSASVPQYIQDAGGGNGAVGHRRWILYPKSYEFGFGSTNWGTAMWVIGGTQNPEIYPDFVAYPSPGYFPKNLIYRRWSFSKKGAKYDRSSVRMVDESGQNVEIMVEEVVNGFGDHTIVWVPETNLYSPETGSDKYFKVLIDSIKIGSEYINYEYEVLGIDVTEEEATSNISQPSCNADNGSIELELPGGYRDIAWSNGISNTPKIDQLFAGSYSATITDKLGCERVEEFLLEDLTKPETISSIIGNQSTNPGIEEAYSTDLHANGAYTWTVSNGEFIGDVTKHEIQVKWNEGETAGGVCVTFSSNEGCKSNELCMDVALITSDINETNKQLILIRQNPVRDIIHLVAPHHHNFKSVNIYNAKGKKVYSRILSTSDDNIILDSSQLNSGIYYVRLEGQDFTKTLRVAKI